jgi:hypothetical protein
MKFFSHIPSPSSLLFILSTSTCPHTVPILQSCLLLLIFKLLFQGVSQCIPTVSIPWSVQSLPLLSLTLPSHSPFFNSFQYTSLYPLLAQMLCFMILLMLYHSLFLFLLSKFHRIVPLLQTCSTSKFVYGHVWFLCVFIFWIYLPCMRGNKRPLSF